MENLTVAERNVFIHNLLQNMIDKEDLRNTQQIINKADNNKVAVIIEPRRHEFLEKVVRNVMYFLPKDEWNLHIITYQDNIEWVKSLFPNWEVTITSINSSNLNLYQYTDLLRSKDLWNIINEENVLIFQTDVMMFHSNINDFLEYDFIGANYFDENDISKNYGGNNGGFSFRHKSAMLDCLDKISNYDVVLYLKSLGRKYVKENVMEDVYFTCACEMIGKKLSTIEDRQYFSVEDSRNDKCLTPVGCHRLYSKELSHTLLDILKTNNLI